MDVSLFWMASKDGVSMSQDHSEPIASLPGQRRLSPSDVLKEIDEARQYGVHAFMLFPKIEDSLKTPLGRATFSFSIIACKENAVRPTLGRFFW